jgi:hypothetical protein
VDDPNGGLPLENEPYGDTGEVQPTETSPIVNSKLESTEGQEDISSIGEEEIFRLSHWGCLAFITLLVVVLVATLFQAIRIFSNPDINSSAPAIVWFMTIILLLGLIIALGWTRFIRRL